MNSPVQLKKLSFSEIAEVVTGSTPSTKVKENYDGDIPFVSPSELDLNAPISRTEITLSKLGGSQARLLPPETVMVCCIGATIGKVGYAGIELATNQQINSLIVDKSIAYPRYVYHYCKTIKPLLRHSSSSTTLPIVNKTRFSQFEIPLPPLEHQQQIARVLDKADELRTKRRTAIQKLDDLLQSVFLDMFGDPVANPKGWDVVKIRDVAEHVNYGSSSKASSVGQFPILRMGNITYEGSWDFTDLKYIDLSEKDASKYLVYKGQILFNRTNSKELVGKTAVYREETPMAFAGYLVRLITNPLANPEYVSAFMNSKYMKTVLQEKCKSIVGMANINAQEFQAFLIPLPSIDLQNYFANVVHTILDRKRLLESALKVSYNLFYSLQQRAFRGELTPQVLDKLDELETKPTQPKLF